MYHKNSYQVRHIWPPSWILESLAGHIQVSKEIGLPIYRPIYQLGRSIFCRFSPVAADVLVCWPTITPPARFSAEFGHFSPRRRGFLRPPTRPRASPDLSAQPPITVRFRPIFALSLPILALLDRLWLLSQSKWGTKNLDNCLSWGDRIPYTWVMESSELIFMFYLIWILSNKMVEIWKNFSTNILKILPSFFT
jgi:hypothetical protein